MVRRRRRKRVVKRADAPANKADRRAILRKSSSSSSNKKSKLAQIDRMPTADDFKHEDWQNAARIYIKQNPDNLEKLWLVITPSDHGGDDKYSGHHWSFVGVCYEALRLNLVSDDLADPNTRDFIDHLISIYDHANPEKQVMEAWNKAIKGSDGIEGVPKTERTMDVFDPKALQDFQETEIHELTKISPVQDLEAVKPLDFLKTVFSDANREYSTKNSKTSKKGHICISENEKWFPLIFDPEKDVYLDHKGDEVYPDEVDCFSYMSQSVFKETSDKPSGRRTKVNLARQVLMVVETDLEDDSLKNKFISVMVDAMRCAPLVYVAFSGGKSYHFGFAIHDADPKELSEFKNQFAILGADRTVLRDKTKLVRLPNVMPPLDSNKTFQELLYFDPKQADMLKAKKWDLELFNSILNERRNLEAWHNKKNFYVKNVQGEWFQTGSIMDWLGSKGYSVNKQEAENLSQATRKKLWIEANRTVHRTFDRLAGHDAGEYHFSGYRVLVCNSRKFPEMPTRKGEWNKIDEYLKELFNPKEYQIFLAWLSDAVRASYNGGLTTANFKPSQMLNIVGEANAGKTALYKHIISKILGGRWADASGMFDERSSDFNINEMGSELLVLDDTKVLNSSLQNRKDQGEIIKNICVGGVGEVHAKGVDKVSANSFKRLVRFLNHDKINTLPMLNEPAVGDKVIVIQAYCRGNEKSVEWFMEMEKHVKREIRYFWKYLLEDHEIPEEIKIPKEKGRRFPCISYHDPEVCAELNETAPSAFLESLIEANEFEDAADEEDNECIEGGIQEIYTRLRKSLTGDVAIRFNKMFASPQKLLDSMRDLRRQNLTQGCLNYIYYSKDDELSKEKLNGSYYWRVVVKTGGEPKAKPEPRILKRRRKRRKIKRTEL